jgi:hypothetical protein
MKAAYSDVRFRSGLTAERLPAAFAVITACNPNGRTVAAEANRQATESLHQALTVGGHETFPVTGGSSDFLHAEPGFGVAFPSREEAVSWGRRFRQEAIFWIAAGNLELVPCDGGPSLMLGTWESRLEQIP